VRGLGWNGVVGYSVVSRARDAIGLGLAADKFGASSSATGRTLG
jgi:hypothetical protein